MNNSWNLASNSDHTNRSSIREFGIGCLIPWIHFFWILHAQWGQNIFKVAIGFLKSIHHVSRIKLLMSLSDSFTNLETTNLQKKFCETEFVYLFLCTKNVNNNIQFRRLVVSKYSWNHLISRSYILKICFKHCTQKYKIYQRL